MRTFSKLAASRKHVGREKSKFSFSVHVHGVAGLGSPASGMPEDASFVVQIARGPKVVTTQLAPCVRGGASWEESLDFVCTLYASKKETRPFSEKTFRLSLLLAYGSKKRQTEVAATELDVAAFASTDLPSVRTIGAKRPPTPPCRSGLQHSPTTWSLLAVHF